MVDSSTEDGVGGAVELEEAPEAFAISVEVAGLGEDGQLAAELGDMYMWWPGEGWRLSLVRLVEEGHEKGGVPETQAVCVVSKARARRGN